MLAQQSRRVHGALHGPGIREDAEQGVVVALADRVELVVVAPGAGHRQSLECLREDVDLVVRPLDPVLPGIHRLEAVFDHPVVARAEERFVQALRLVVAGALQQVAGQVLPNQLVVGNVGVQGADQVIAVAPRLGQIRIALAPVRLGVTHQIHPVPRPALAEVGRLQQAVHDRLEGLGRSVGGEGFDLRGSWRQARQRVRDAAQERVPVRLAGRSQAIPFQFRQDVAIHGRAGPILALHRWRLRGAHLLPGPMFPPAALEVENLAGIRRAGRLLVRPGRARVDPGGQVGDPLLAQPTGRRHGRPRLAPHRLHQQARRRVSRHHRRARIAPLQDARAAVEPQAREYARSLGAMAGVAMLRQQRPDPLLEMLQIGRTAAPRPHERHGGRSRESDRAASSRGSPELHRLPSLL